MLGIADCSVETEEQDMWDMCGPRTGLKAFLSFFAFQRFHYDSCSIVTASACPVLSLSFVCSALLAQSFVAPSTGLQLLPFCWRMLFACSGSMWTNLVTNECPSPRPEKTGNSQYFDWSPKTSAKFRLKPKENPFLSGPLMKTGALKASIVVRFFATSHRW